MNKTGFDNDRYVALQSQNIKKRIAQFGGKLYLEFGGKLFDDHHAARVLPGFHPDSKIRMLMELRETVEIVVVISAGSIEENKRRGDLGITYDADALRLIDAFRDCGLYVGSVVITHYQNQPAAARFKKLLEDQGLPVYCHYIIPNYPSDLELIVSADGFGKNDYVKTSRSLVVVTAPGPGSGKMATCLSQLYHEHQRGIAAGYAKFETFPVWNLPLRHPVNLAYEAATADLDDVNMIDPFHLEAYNQTAVNYNRDVEIFPVLNAMLERIWGASPYKSPTDMGVNMVGFCITDGAVCEEASRQEIIRRYYAAACDWRRGLASREMLLRLEMLLNRMGLNVKDRPAVGPALQKAEETGAPAVAMELPDGSIVTGKTSSLLGAASACLLNALKHLAGLPKEVLLIAPEIIAPIQRLKTQNMGSRNPRLHTDEILIALAISAVSDRNASQAMDSLTKLEGSQVHASVILSQVDVRQFSKLGCQVTCEPKYQAPKLFHQ